MKSGKKRGQAAATRIVGTVHTAAGLRAAVRLRPGSGIDVVEVRLDCLARRSSALVSAVREIRLPVLLTARHPAEGGHGALTSAQRLELLEEFLPLASLLDVELRAAEDFAALLRKARRRKVESIVSFHDFARTPSSSKLSGLPRRALLSGADICKIAVQVRTAADLARLLLVQSRATKPLATMGMGPLGKVSRLLLPLAGACLAYGYIDRPQVRGQWPAPLLAQRLREVRA